MVKTPLELTLLMFCCLCGKDLKAVLSLEGVSPSPGALHDVVCPLSDPHLELSTVQMKKNKLCFMFYDKQLHYVEV